ncbi:uncharacterized protein A4U43_C04F14660 [Asparagus officinalis]|uniref:Uncharacterized protein n=1 Tax=Asparagus officinalis TaxID=4686 RepID=A0A5P1F0W9_ASPOF|nr:uncharacterized protein A4U43_C04F14660 [Asparagus officinalis]
MHWIKLTEKLREQLQGNKFLIVFDDMSAIKHGAVYNLHCPRLMMKEVGRPFPDHTCPKELVNSSRKIVEKRDGLPLAVMPITSVLAAKPRKDVREWENTLNHLSSELENNPNLEEMRKIFDLSYNDLRYPIRHCFLYLKAVIPEDTECLVCASENVLRLSEIALDVSEIGFHALEIGLHVSEFAINASDFVLYVSDVWNSGSPSP